MSSPTITSIIKDFTTLISIIAATALVAFLALFAGAMQIGMTVGLGSGVAAGFMPEDSITDPCETTYNCKPKEAVLMEYNAK